ncbi:hypothetical protein [Spongiimicrobium salis]|uniref:hypothetical protein n=1 Tax=Spongiimicrobium salis TaxID=1667022 RepID=UPI00374D3AC4
MNESPWIIILGLLILFMQIGLGIYFYRYLELFKKETTIQLNFVKSEANSIVVDTKKEIAKLGLTNATFLEHQKELFESFTKALELDYQYYVDLVAKTNQRFTEINVQLETSITDYERLKTVLVQSAKQLEFLSDQFHELISQNQQEASNFRQYSDTLFASLANSGEDKFNRLTAQGEKKLSESVRTYKQLILEVVDSSKEMVNKFFDQRHSDNFKKDIEELAQLKMQFYGISTNVVSEIKTIGLELENALEMIKTKKKKRNSSFKEKSYPLVYHQFPDKEGFFWRDKIHDTPENRSTYEMTIMKDNLEKATFRFWTESMNIKAVIHDYIVYLEPVCEIVEHAKNGTKIEQIGVDGELYLDGDKWRVVPDKKLRIKIVE